MPTKARLSLDSVERMGVVSWPSTVQESQPSGGSAAATVEMKAWGGGEGWGKTCGVSLGSRAVRPANHFSQENKAAVFENLGSIGVISSLEDLAIAVL